MSALSTQDAANVLATFGDYNRSGDRIGEECNGDKSHTNNGSSGRLVFPIFRQWAFIAVVSHEAKSLVEVSDADSSFQVLLADSKSLFL